MRPANGTDGRPRALVLSSLGRNTGCALRARYLAGALEALGWRVAAPAPPFPSLPGALEVFLSLPSYLLACLREKPDLAVAIKPYPNAWIPLWILRLLGRTAVADVDDLDGGYRGGLLGLLGRASQAPAFRLLDRFSTHHPELRRWLEEKQGVKPERVVWLGQGVDTDLFRPEAVPVEEAGACRLAAGGRRVLLFSAHLNVACEFPLLLEWAAPLLKERADVVLVVAGGGPRLDEFKALAASAGLEGRCLFTGALKPEGVRAWMALASACLAVYGPGEANRYRVPMKVGEYLAMGRPVVCNPIGGLAGLEPYLYTCGAEAGDFRRALGALLEGGGDGREERGREYARASLDWRRVAERFLKELGAWPLPD